MEDQIEKLTEENEKLKDIMMKSNKLYEESYQYGYYLSVKDYATARKHKEIADIILKQMRLATVGILTTI